MCSSDLMTFNDPRVFELYRRYAAPDAYLFLRGAQQLPPEAVLDAAAIGTLALQRDAGDDLLAMATARGYREQVDGQAKQWFERGRSEHADATLRLVVDQFYAGAWGDDALWLLDTHGGAPARIVGPFPGTPDLFGFYGHASWPIAAAWNRR